MVESDEYADAVDRMRREGGRFSEATYREGPNPALLEVAGELRRASAPAGAKTPGGATPAGCSGAT